MGWPGNRYALLLGLTLLFRGWLSAALPVTGDEAYFIGWGWHPDWGFYDHPPMVGWWLAALSLVSDEAVWLRLPSTLQPALLSLATWWALPRLWPGIDDAPGVTGIGRREGIALLVLLAPAHIWNVAITTDTPLVYFSVLSALTWLRASQQRAGDGWRWYALAGALLAGAILSKYFAALLGFAYLIDVLRRRTRRSLGGLAIAYACCLPALGLMAWWNSANCWPNYLFNFVNRHSDAGPSLLTPLLYLASLLYLLTPPALWMAWRRLTSADARRKSLWDFSEQDKTLLTLFAVPLVLFALLSIPKTIGLHWLLSFFPLTLIWIGLRVNHAQLATLTRFFVGFGLLHVLVIVILPRLPIDTWKELDFYESLVLTTHHANFAEIIAHERSDPAKRWVLAAESYANAATLGYNLREHVRVFGTGSSHARHDDIRTDFRALDGRNFLIIRKRLPVTEAYQPYFDQVDISRIEVHSAHFWLIRGEGFHYQVYRDQVLREVREHYYRIPGWLPQRACYFDRRYFADETSRE